ncbi:MAG TPA: TonB-dependent receptor, partial [Chitinophagaceae bacterium]|nr:TonB-dependent receptor [Chitinophagaceae bacterium]
MKPFLFSLFFLLTGALCRGQASLSGSVLSPAGLAVPGATVQLQAKGFRQTALSNDSGRFRLQGVPRGTVLLTVRHTGFDPYTASLVFDGTDTSVTVPLSVQLTTLPAVEVTGRTARKYNSDYSFGATRFAVLNKELPQAISTITKELIADRQAFHLADAVRMASGVIPSSYYNQYAIRGISQNEEGQIVNGMRTRQYYFLQPLTTHIERVEVIKGPASATFSSVDPGGSINLVTKKPLATPRREIGISVGSFSTIRGTLDFTGPLNEEKTLLYRVNGAYQEARSYRDLVSNKSFLLAPSLSYLPGPNTAINVELTGSNMRGNLDRGQPIFGAVAGRTDLNSTPIGLNLGAASDYFHSKELTVMGTFGHKFTRRLGVNVAYMKQTWTEDLQEHRTTNAFGVDTANRPVSSLAAMQFVQRRQYWNTDNINSYLTYEAQTGSVRHQLLLGYDLHRWEKGKGGGQNAARGYLLKDGTVAPSYNPAQAALYQTMVHNGVTLPRPNVAHFDLSHPSYPIRSSGDYLLNVRTALPPALTRTQALYFQELLHWRKFHLLLSLRHEWFRDITRYR